MHESETKPELIPTAASLREERRKRHEKNMVDVEADIAKRLRNAKLPMMHTFKDMEDYNFFEKKLRQLGYETSKQSDPKNENTDKGPVMVIDIPKMTEAGPIHDDPSPKRGFNNPLGGIGYPSDAY